MYRPVVKTLFLFLSFLAITSCGDDDQPDPVDELPMLSINDALAVEVATEAIAEFIDEDLEKLVLYHLLNLAQAHEGGGIIETHLPDDPFGGRNDCASFTVDENAGTILIDFGSGCESPNGILRSGRIRATMTNEEHGVFRYIIIMPEQYALENIRVEGVREITNNVTTALEYSEITSSVTNGRLVFGDESEYTYNSERSFSYEVASGGEQREEFAFLTKINKTGTNRNGESFTSSSESGLTYLTECFVSGLSQPSAGVFNISINTTNKSIDFGATDCSAIVRVTDEAGNEFQLDLSELIINTN